MSGIALASVAFCHTFTWFSRGGDVEVLGILFPVKCSGLGTGCRRLLRWFEVDEAADDAAEVRFFAEERRQAEIAGVLGRQLFHGFAALVVPAATYAAGGGGRRPAQSVTGK